MRIDHVTIAGSDLSRLARTAAGLGLAPTYGGLHSNGVTHMAACTFEDGSYLELISTIESGRRSPWWPRHILHDGGVCGWCVGVEDLDAEVARLRKARVQASQPSEHERAVPDGGTARWRLSFLGRGEPGANLPFLIEDITPRSIRVRPRVAAPRAHEASGSAPASLTPPAGAPRMTGVACVIIGVMTIDRVARMFEQAYGHTTAAPLWDERFGATMADVGPLPVALAQPRERDSWLSYRIARFGEGPCAALLAAGDLDRAAERLPIAAWSDRPGSRIAWIDQAAFLGVRIGLVAAPRP